VLTTHNLEFIDCLLAATEGPNAPTLAVYNLLLNGGRLSAVRRDAAEARAARDAIALDLR
jgi:hypothetical protein